MTNKNSLFVKEDLIQRLAINTKSLDQLLDVINLEQSERKTLKFLFSILKKLSASINAFYWH